MEFASPADLSPVPNSEASRDCPLCPRLVALRHECRAEHPDWWNAPVPSFGDPSAWLAIVGLAPGKHGANRTGRPFTGDHAGELLYATLLKFGLAKGEYRASRDDELRLEGAVILNAVKCLPPGNKPLPIEEANCRPFLKAAVNALPKLRVFVALGKVAHESLCRSVEIPLSEAKFGHGAVHELPAGRRLVDSYHCSRRNLNTGLLDAAMFEAVFEKALAL
jgi:uracil-DNA glycosylase family 4